MAELTKQALQVQNNTEFPNNNAGLITPTNLRTFNSDMIDSLVDEISYNIDSASFNSRINSVTGSSAITASSLITASFDNGTRNLTFTKGDASQFSVNIPDVSGSTGNFATTGSNTFIGTQTISGSVLPLVDGQGDLGTDSLKWNSVVVNGQIKGSSINASGRSSLGTVRLLDESFPLSFLDAREIVGDGSGVDTHLYYGTGSAANALREFVYAQSGSNADFTAVSASFNTRINNATGSVINTGSFATTGSNSFVGNQTIAGGLIVSSSQPISFSGSSFLVNTFDGGGEITFRPGTAINFQGNTNFTAPIRTTIVNVDNLAGGGFYGFNNETTGRIYQDFSGSVDSRINAIVAGTGFATTGSNTFTGNQNIQGTLTASLQEGYVWAGGAGNISTLVATSSFGGGGTIDTGSFATTGSNTFIGNQTITTDGNTDLNISSSLENGQANLYFRAFQSNFQSTGNFQFGNYGQFGGSGSVNFVSTLNNLSLAADAGVRVGPTNGGGNGINTQAISLQSHSGSLSLAPSGFNNTTASLSHISSSSGTNFVNLMFKPNNNTAGTIVSGSGNIWTNAGAATAGFVRYIGGAQNYFGATLPQLTGSAAFPVTMANNIANSGMLLRLPVSSSTYTINSNVLVNAGSTAVNLGTAAATNFERAVAGLTMTNNVIAGAINATAWKTPLSASITIGSNMIGGTVGLNMDSSSISFNGNSVQGGFTVNNSYFPATTGSQVQTSVNGGLFIGSNNTIYLSGSNTTLTGSPGRTITNAIMLGTNNVISASLNSDLAQVASTSLIGQGLVVVGTNSRLVGPSAADWGSVFVGRWNSDLGTADTTAETVFAVGTGTGASTRKTGFLIDSGSNTFIEGTLNVSGSTTLSGSLYIQSGSTLPSATGSSILTWNSATGQVSQSPMATLISSSFSVGAFNSTITQSGSAAVSQSMTLNNTDISNGISVVSNSQITFAITGTYNIQFSAQLLSSSGQDDVYIWIKKNGTNVDNTATKVILANNEAGVAAWNWVVTANAGDYYELVWQSRDGHATLSAAAATGNIPGIPSLIVTATQVE